jgi:hypothetical protein
MGHWLSSEGESKESTDTRFTNVVKHIFSPFNNCNEIKCFMKKKTESMDYFPTAVVGRNNHKENPEMKC